MMKFTKYYFLIFPILIVIIGSIMYKLLGYEPTTLTILINIGLAFILSPRVKKFETQTGVQEQVTWLFFKKTKQVS
ncbi:hypothetical protein RQM59_02085 [Flavobacteriaceae bacterium S356]|uniref:Uncharacterized protein n=1 Tax=Asprobacillus argus TaxID=3076534 RepID=A0ABU3LCL2_9FLAO|nr:hypothetical protein [Flavobacteriaceae bacterium S356]